MRKACDFEFDYLVIGSGFGGSVAAMRLAQKGYTVGIVEAGRHWQADEFTRRNWNLRKFLWMPGLGLHGTWRLRLLNKVFILAGAGVGGGSLNYANTLYVPPDVFFERDSLRRLGGKAAFAPYYDLAGRMLGVVRNPVETAQDILLRETAAEMNRGETYRPTPVGVFFGTKGEVSPDPYFDGEGPDRTGCELCGECMTGCRKDAKNSLDKNYLYFARKFGARIFAQNKAVDVRPASPDGNDGYLVRTKNVRPAEGPERIDLQGRRNRFRRRNARDQPPPSRSEKTGPPAQPLRVISAGMSGPTARRCSACGRSTPRPISPPASRSPRASIPTGKPTSSPSGSARGTTRMSLLVAALTDGRKKIPRFFRWAGNEILHPIRHARLRKPSGWAKKTIILLVMQTVDNFFHLKIRRPWFFPFVKTLKATAGDDRRNPTWIPIGNEFARRLAGRVKGVAGNVITEVTVNAPITAHILGGCSFGPTPEEGVIDAENRVKGYPNMFVCDGSQIPENLGVNPALSITAFAERAMSFVPAKKDVRYLRAEKKWGLDSLLSLNPGPARHPSALIRSIALHRSIC